MNVLKYGGWTLEETLNQTLQGKRRLQQCMVLSEPEWAFACLFNTYFKQKYDYLRITSGILKSALGSPGAQRCHGPANATGVSSSLGLQMAQGKKLLVRSVSWAIWTSTFTEPCQSNSCQRGLECLPDLLIKITKYHRMWIIEYQQRYVLLLYCICIHPPLFPNAHTYVLLYKTLVYVLSCF